MKKNVLKSILFVIFFVVITEILTYVVLPGSNVRKMGMIKVATYEVLGEQKNTIDVAVIGDSLVYSSLSPMVIWNEFGYTTFDCSNPAQLITESYGNLEAVTETQKPKIVILEANELFRDDKHKKLKYKMEVLYRKLIPIATYHNNWKNYFMYGGKDDWINIYKGYKYITKVESGKSNYEMTYSSKKEVIPDKNKEYFDKIYELCKKNNIKLVVVSFPTQISWNYKKHNSTETLLEQYSDVEFIDLNTVDLGIDWKKETKDEGGHLNYLGARKVSTYIGEYIKSTELVEDKRGNKKYASWDEAYKKYVFYSNNQ